MAHWTGNALYIQWIYSGGTVVLHTDFRSLTHGDSLDSVDVSAGVDAQRTYIETLRDTTLSGTFLSNLSGMPAGDGGTAVHRALAIGNAGTLTWGPLGTATGNPKYQLHCFVESFDRDYPYDDTVEFDVAWKPKAVYALHYELSGSVW